MNALVERLWAFIRGDEPAASFEHWAYTEPSLESLLGESLYARVMSVDYHRPEQVHELRHALSGFVESLGSLPCQCVTIADGAVIPMADPDARFSTVAPLLSRGIPFSWISIDECEVCRTRWLVGADMSVNDVVVVRRMSAAELSALEHDARWPSDFDHFETLLRAGNRAGFGGTWVDPLGAAGAASAAFRLLSEQPDISISTVASLLQVDERVATTLIDRARAELATKRTT